MSSYRKQEPLLQLQCITTKVMKCFKINKLFQDNIVMCLEDEYIYIVKPNEKLYMINVIDLHMLKQNKCILQMMFFFGSTCPVIKIKFMLNDRI